MADPIESRMNFIIEQQAQFAADIQIHKERQAETLRMTEANARMIRKLVEAVDKLVRRNGS